LVTLDFRSSGALRHGLSPAELVVERELPRLRDAVRVAADHLNVEIAPFHGDRYFAAWRRTRPKPSELHPVLDIHVVRDGLELCPKHDLDFQLLNGDIVYFAGLIC
jgi:hypothetical protein